MAASTTSSLTSTSHTLTYAPGMAPITPTSAYTPMLAPDLTALFDCLQAGNRHRFLQPSASLPSASLLMIKNTLDSFAGSVSDEQLHRLRTATSRNKNKKKESKRKRDGDGDDDGDRASVLKLRRVHLDGFDTGQVWQQAKRIIHGALDFSHTLLQDLRQSGAAPVPAVDTGAPELQMLPPSTLIDQADRDDDSVDDSVDQLTENDNAGLEMMSQSGSEKEKWEDLSGSENDDGLVDDLDDPNEANGDDGSQYEQKDDSTGVPETLSNEHGINDDFFNLEEFNRQTLWLEREDAEGNPFTDQASDDEEIDWNADPMLASAAASANKSKLKLNGVDASNVDGLDGDSASDFGADDRLGGVEGYDDDEEEEEEMGPTFGNMALDAPDGASEDDDEPDEEDPDADPDAPEANANGIRYKDFFAPPRKKNKAMTESTHNNTHKSVRFDLGDSNDGDEAELQRAMADVKHDLFDDLSDQGDQIPAGPADGPTSRQSAHERRQGKLSEQIRRLESELVSKRAWTLSGEAAAADRPVNSLLEEQLDFEHAGKPVLVVTPEVTEAIEDLIKRRILSRDFNEIRRRRPDEAQARRGLAPTAAAATLDDAKSSRGLAELYEEKHVQAANPDGYVSKSDEKVQAEEREVERLWLDLCNELDALSNWNFRPRPPAPAVTVIADVAAVAMEDAQPTTGLTVSAAAESVLAPQEVFRPGANLDPGQQPAVLAGDVVLRHSGAPVARVEMTREDRTRRRRRAKERIHKASSTATVSGTVAARGSTTVVAKQHGDMVADLRRGGVAVINRRGELVDVDGNKAKPGRQTTGSQYKL